MNHYEVLEVSTSASLGVIKAAYKSLMQRYHPDRNPDDAQAAARSIAVVQAYEVLSDPVRRAAYDDELKLQSYGAKAAQDRVHNILAAAADKAEPRSRWWAGLPLAALFAALLWFMFAPSGNREPAAASGDAGSSALSGLLQAEPQPEQSDVRAIPVEARTIPAFMKDISVIVVAPPLPGGTAAVGSRYVLSIQTVGVVAGRFDPDKFMSFLESNKEYIGQKLTKQLAGARYDLLIRHDGDHYLRQFILAALSETTGTGAPENAVISGSQPARYGAVDVLLPDSYSVTPELPNSVVVP